MAKPGSLIYNPEIQVIIATNGNSVIDVSSDIISFSLQRNANAPSEFSCTLANKLNKYNLKIQTLDRIVVFMKRTNKLQVFSGYVTYAPVVTLLPNAVEVRAVCTLKRLENTFWDTSIPEFQALVPGMISGIQGQQSFTDGGTGAGIVNILTQVVGWKKNAIHIQKIPNEFITQVATSYEKTSKKLDSTLQTTLALAIDAAGITHGNFTGTNQVQRQSDTPDGAGLPGPSAGCTAYGGPHMTPSNKGINNTPRSGSIVGDNIQKDSKNSTGDPQWYAAVHFPYKYMFPPKDGMQWSPEWAKPVEWLKGPDGLGRRIIVVNASDHSKAITVRAADYLGGERTDWENSYHAQIDLDSRACIALGFPWSGSGQNDGVLMFWAKDPKGKCGPLKDTQAIQEALGSTSSAPDPLTTTSSNGTAAQNAIAQLAIAAAESQIHLPYIWGGETAGVGFDCSGLVQWAYAQAGVHDLTHSSEDQWAIGPQVTSGMPQPGDLLFWYYSADSQASPNHVTMCVQSTDSYGNNGVQIQSGGDKNRVHTGRFSINDTSYLKFVGFTRPWLINGDNTIGVNSSGVSAQSAANDSAGPQINTQDTFNTIFVLPQFNPVAQMTFHSPRAFVTDEPVLNSITQLTKAALRNFQSAPNGDFVAWFPDYFGRYGKAPVLQVRDIEIINLTIYKNDDPLTTHVGVTGDQVEFGQGVVPIDWLSTQGIVSVQENNIMRILFGLDDLDSIGWDSEKFLNKYGMRPYVAEQPLLRSHLLEFAYALTMFMQKWSDQYSTQISLTFMPEVYPGMRLQFPDVQLAGANGETGPLEVYVQQVVHEGSTTTGYNTNVTVTAPSVAGNMLTYGIS